MKRFVIHEFKQIESVIDYVRELELGGVWEVVVRKHIRDRSAAQNRLWHKWVGILAKEKGYFIEDMKHIIKRKILGIIEFMNQDTGEVEVRVKSTAELSVKEFSELMNQTEVLAAQENIILPTPLDYQIAHGLK